MRKQDELLEESEKRVLEDKLISATDDINYLKETIKQKDLAISDLETRVTVYQVEVKGWKDEYESLDYQVAKLESQIQSDKEKIKKLKEELASAMLNNLKKKEDLKFNELFQDENVGSTEEDEIKDVEEKSKRKKFKKSKKEKMNRKF